jgi:alpha-L-rhamnosidase
VPEKADPRYFEALPEFLRTSEARRRWEIRFSTPEKFQESVKSYYRLIYGVDVVIGRIRELLRQLGFDDNTVLILIGDNGFFLGEYALAGKWFPYEESIRVPLVVFDPRAGKKLRGRILSQMALNVDIAPTILELAGVKTPEQMQGCSLVPLLKGKKPKWRTEFFYEHPFEHKTIAKSVGLRTQDYMHIRYTDYNYEELYDLKHDPAEKTNLAKNEKYGKTLESLRKHCNELAHEL